MIHNLINQLRDNPRLRWGVILIVGLCWLYIVLLLRDTLQKQELQHRTIGQAVSRLRTQLTQPEWINRVSPAKTMSVQLEERLWQAPTSGLAQAAFQEWLNAAMIKANIAHPQITVTLIDDTMETSPEHIQNDGTTTPTDLWKIKAKIGFDFNTAALLSLLEQIENHDKEIVVGALKASKQPMNRIEIELYSYFPKQDTKASPPKELVPL